MPMRGRGGAECPTTPKGFLQFAKSLGTQHEPHVIRLARHVWGGGDRFVRWPTSRRRPLLSCARCAKGETYAAEDRLRIAKAKELLGDLARGQFVHASNGPAVLAFLLAGGLRPRLRGSKGRWSVHHVYDGRFPAPNRERSTHAVKNPRYFTDARGLVAVHPVADALAHEVDWFAWQLRFGAWQRFAFDPDGIFREWLAEEGHASTQRAGG